MKRLSDVVRCDHDRPANAAMNARSLDGAAHVGFVGHVHDRIVNEHGIELTIEADCPHIALNVLEIRIEGLAHQQHPGGLVDECHTEVLLHMPGIVAASAPELENRFWNAIARRD
jgi:hypothetical protein